MPSQITSAPFDTSSLLDPVDSAEVRDFRAAVRQADTNASLRRATGHAVLATIGYVLAGLAIEGVLGVIPVWILFSLDMPGPGVIVMVVVPSVVMVLLFIWIGPRIRDELRARDGWPRRFRLARFAAANGLSYGAEFSNPPRVSTVFATGNLRYGWDFFSCESFVTGNYRTDDFQNRMIAPRGWRFLSVRLERAVPHLLLLPKTTALPARLVAEARASQTLRLEGGFERHFTLLVPTGYERDALYIITPDLMAALIDHAPGSVVEMIGNRLTIATPGPRDATQPETWEHLHQLLKTIGSKGVRQTQRYQDDQSPIVGSVAHHGQALKRGIPIAGVVLVGMVLLEIVSRLPR